MTAPLPPYQVKALYEYSSPHDDDLSFPNGQVLTVTDEEDADWLYGEYLDTAGDKQEGLFPRNFVKIYEPETPPRPSRLSRQKKEVEALPVPTKEADDHEPETPTEQSSVNVPASTIPDTTRPVEDVPRQQPMENSLAKSSKTPPTATSASTAPKTVSSTGAKPKPQQFTETPTGGSFRDRINAFNKSAAAPVAPKPGGAGSASGTGFIKKSFVAPPPSKNAFVPPPRDTPTHKIYRREEDPDVVAQANNEKIIERPVPSNVIAPTEGEDQPKPTSLKERIALLQQQQMEQASRHAEAAQKKDKPRRPPKKRMESQERVVQADDDDQILERITSAGSIGSRAAETPTEEVQPEPPSAIRQHKPREPNVAESPIVASSRGFQSDANDADQSGAGDTEEGDDLSTSRDDSDEKARVLVLGESHRAAEAPAKEPDVGDEEGEADEEGEKDEEDVDPEFKRRMEIRERMAKMSGGMGMAGMFGPPGGISGIAPKKQPSVPGERKATAPSTSEEQASRAAPVPLIPMAGMQKVLSPEQSNSPVEVDKEQSEGTMSVSKGREPYDMPDLEDLKEEPTMQPRKSIERRVPSAGHQGKY